MFQEATGLGLLALALVKPRSFFGERLFTRPAFSAHVVAAVAMAPYIEMVRRRMAFPLFCSCQMRCKEILEDNLLGDKAGSLAEAA